MKPGSLNSEQHGRPDVKPGYGGTRGRRHVFDTSLSLPVVTGVANTLLRQAGLPRVVHGIEQCGSVLFGQLYEALTGARPPGGGESEAERCQAVVDAFSEQLAPHVSLEHIRGRDLASRDPITIINLLDIFSGQCRVCLSASIPLSSYTHSLSLHFPSSLCVSIF